MAHMPNIIELISQGSLLHIDPGSGSTLLQRLIAGLLGSLFLIKVYWKKISSKFKNSRNNNSVNLPDDENSDNQTDL